MGFYARLGVAETSAIHD